MEPLPPKAGMKNHFYLVDEMLIFVVENWEQLPRHTKAEIVSSVAISKKNNAFP